MLIRQSFDDLASGCIDDIQGVGFLQHYIDLGVVRAWPDAVRTNAAIFDGIDLNRIAAILGPAEDFGYILAANGHIGVVDTVKCHEIGVIRARTRFEHSLHVQLVGINHRGVARNGLAQPDFLAVGGDCQISGTTGLLRNGNTIGDGLGFSIDHHQFIGEQMVDVRPLPIGTEYDLGNTLGRDNPVDTLTAVDIENLNSIFTADRNPGSFSIGADKSFVRGAGRAPCALSVRLNWSPHQSPGLRWR